MQSSRYLMYWVKKKIRNTLIRPKPQVGRNVYIDHNSLMIGASNISIGDNTIIGEETRFNVNQRDKEIRVVIGRNCLINRGSFFLTSNRIKLGDYFLGGEYCRFLGANHDISDPLKPYVVGDTDQDKEIIVGTNVWFGANVTVLGNVHIGYGTIIGANSLVTHDIPPFSIAVGSPAKVIKHYNFQIKKWIPKDTDIEKKWIPSEEDYLAQIEANYRDVLLPVEAVTKRFGGL